jgi:hypothetical protein
VDYTPPPPPYVPPAPPLQPQPVTYYEVKASVIKYYGSVENAKSDTAALGVIDKGTYIEQKRDGSAVQLTKTNHDVTTYWINDFDNKPEVAVTPPVIEPPVDIVVPEVEPVDLSPVEWVRPVTRSLRPDGKPVYFQALNEVEVDIPDLRTGEIIDMPPYNDDKLLPITHEFQYGGQKYYLPKEIAKRQWWNAIPAHLLKEQGTIEHAYSPFDLNEDGDVDAKDVGELFGDFIDFGSKHFMAVKNTVFKVATNPKITVAKQRINKAVDGFSKRSK